MACVDLIDEMRTYVIDARGITNAQQGCYDDRVMAYAIALFGLNSMPRKHRINITNRKKKSFLNERTRKKRSYPRRDSYG